MKYFKIEIKEVPDTNPAFEEELQKALQDIYNNRNNISYSLLKALKRFANKKS